MNRAGSPNLQHHFAEMCVGFHVGERRCGFIEREAAVYRERQLAGAHRGPQVLPHQAVDFADLLHRACAKSDTDVGDALGRVQVEIEFAFRAAQPADVDDAAEHAGGLQVRIGDAGRDLIDDQVHAFALRGSNDLVGPTRMGGIDRKVRAPGAEFCAASWVGGGANHRIGLYDMIMIKDNHIDYAGGIKQAIDAANSYLKTKKKKLKIEVEARNLDEVKQILAIGNIHRVMLDNFSITDTKKAVQLINRKYETESSGGITEKTIAAYAKCGVDFISVGALTHNIKSLDLSLKAI